MRQHGYSKRRTRGKVHLGVDTDTREVVTGLVTTNSVGDGEVLPTLRDQFEDPMARLSADGAYDNHGRYQAIEARGPKPPSRRGKNAVPWAVTDDTPYAAERNAALETIESRGLTAWQHRATLRLALLLFAVSLPQLGLTMPVVGWVEHVKIYPGEMILEAKLDTGAEYSSIDARDIEEFERKGVAWVRFRIVNRDGQSLALERPLLREARITRHFGKRQRRPVVKLGVCVGDAYEEVQVNLVNRSGFSYPMLIGRTFMHKKLLLDSSLRNTVSPTCPKASNAR